MTLQGGCFCGRIRYAISGETFNRTNCHCSMCRRTSGAAFVTWFTVKRPNFRWSRGEPATIQSSPKATRSFCRECGTPLAFMHVNFVGEIDVTTCSLDAPEDLPPLDHVRTSSRLPWIKLADGLPEYPEARSHA